MKGKNVREEPKGIVFISKLLLVFTFCHLCFFPNPEVFMKQTGTMLSIEAKCHNCKDIFFMEKPAIYPVQTTRWKPSTEFCSTLCWKLNKETSSGV